MLSLAGLAAELLRHRPRTIETPRSLLYKRHAPFAFKEHESLRGGTARACYLAGVPNSFSVLGQVGLKHRNVVSVAEDPDIDETALADALGADLAEIKSRRYPKDEHGKRYFYGLRLPANSIDSRIRRFAPTFLTNEGYHHAAWELKFLPFCPVTWDILQSSCNACSGGSTHQGWTKTLANITSCDTCGRPLSRQPVTLVDQSMQPVLEIIARLVTTNEAARQSVYEILPPALQQCQLQALLDVILGITKNVSVPAGKPRELVQIAKLHAACQSVLQWPHGLQELTFQIAPDSPVFINLVQMYMALGVEPVTPEVAAIITKCTDATKPTQPGCPREPSTLIGLREATAAAGLTADQLTQIWAVPLLPKRYKMHGRKLLPAFDTDELAAFAKAWKAQIPTRAVAHRFGLPNYAIEQCAQLNLLAPSPLALPKSGYLFIAEDVERFASKFPPSAAEADEDSISLKVAMRQISGRLKPWGLIFDAICDGRLPASIVAGPDDKLTSRIRINASSFETIVGPHFDSDTDCIHGLSEMIPQADALEILNCSATSAGVLQGLDTIGVNPKLFHLNQVLQRAREIVATSDIAARLQLDNTRTYNLLCKAKVPQIVPSGWERQAAFQLIAKTNALKAAQLALDI